MPPRARTPERDATRPPARGDERAFTVIEVIIAAILLVAVASGVVLALAGSLDVSQSRDVKVRMTSAATRTYEHLRSEKDWIKACRKKPADGVTKCNLKTPLGTGAIKDLMYDDVLDTEWKLNAYAVGIDNDGDGVDKKDLDGNRHDFFRVVIEVSIPAADQKRLGTTKVVSMTSMVNGSTNADTGSLVVQVCGAANQIDERIEIAGCAPPFTSFQMPTCGDSPGCKPWSLLPGTAPASLGDWTRWVSVTPISTGVKVRLVDPPYTSYSSTVAVSEGTGTWRFAELPTGTYEVYGYGAKGWSDWGSHHIPSSKRATVERRETARALVMMQRKTSSDAFKMTFDREVTERFLGDASKTFGSGVKPECEEPSGYNSSNYHYESVSCNPATGLMTIEGAVNCGPCTLTSYYRSQGEFEDYAVVRYIEGKGTDDHIWDGAAGSATYLTRPEPFGRFVNIVDGTKKSYSVPEWSKSVSRAPVKNGGWDKSGVTGTSTQSISGLPAGLSRTPAKTAASKIDNVSVTWKPAGCEKSILWVAAGSGGISTCSGFHARGNADECYTTLNSAYSADYKLRVGCGGIYWPPLKGTIMDPGYLVHSICKYRISWINNVISYSTMGIGDADPDEFPTLSTGGWVKIGPGKYRLWEHSGASFVHKTDLGCEPMPTPKAPIMCPAPNRWDNCSTAVILKIPRTDGIQTSSSVTDGQRPPRNYGTLTEASG